jgi:hypothetical protein
MTNHLTRRTALKSIFCGAASFGMPALRSKQGVSPESSRVDETEPSERRAMEAVAEEDTIIIGTAVGPWHTHHPEDQHHH